MNSNKILFLLAAFGSLALVAQNEVVNDTTLIKRAAYDYIDGAYSGDVVRMERAIHPEIQKVIPRKITVNSNSILQYSNYTLLIEGTRAGVGNLSEDKRNIKYQLLDKDQNIATIKIESAAYIDYCHLAKMDGEWKIVNVLWRLNR